MPDAWLWSGGEREREKGHHFHLDAAWLARRPFSPGSSLLLCTQRRWPWKRKTGCARNIPPCPATVCVGCRSSAYSLDTPQPACHLCCCSSRCYCFCCCRHRPSYLLLPLIKKTVSSFWMFRALKHIFITTFIYECNFCNTTCAHLFFKIFEFSKIIPKLVFFPKE